MKIKIELRSVIKEKAPDRFRMLKMELPSSEVESKTSKIRNLNTKSAKKTTAKIKKVK